MIEIVLSDEEVAVLIAGMSEFKQMAEKGKKWEAAIEWEHLIRKFKTAAVREFQKSRAQDQHLSH